MYKHEPNELQTKLMEMVSKQTQGHALAPIDREQASKLLGEAADLYNEIYAALEDK